MADFSVSQAILTGAVAIVSAFLGAYLSRLNEWKKLEFSRKDRARSLKAAIAAEIRANLQLVFDNDLQQALWILQRRRDAYRLNHRVAVNRDVYETQVKHFGDVDPELASQLIFYYAQMKMFEEKFSSLNQFFDNDINSTEEHVIDPYRQVEKLLALKTSLMESGIALMRALNGNRAVGEGDVTFRIDPSEQEQAIAKTWADESHFRRKYHLLKRAMIRLRYRLY